MRTLVALALLIGLAFAGIVLSPATERSGPTPIVHGRDACDACRMRLDRPGFAAELLRDGRVRMFDDLGCLARAAAEVPERAQIWVEDHGSGELVALADATLVRSSRVRTPMGSGVVAFRDRTAAAEHRRRTQGEFVTIEQLVPARGEDRS